MDEIRLIDGNELEKRIAELAKAEEDKGNKEYAVALRFAAMITHQQTTISDLNHLLHNTQNLDHSEEMIRCLKEMLHALDFYRNTVSFMMVVLEKAQGEVSEVAFKYGHT